MTLEDQIKSEEEIIENANNRIRELKKENCLRSIKLGHPYIFEDVENPDDHMMFIFIPKHVVEIAGAFHVFGIDYYHCESELVIDPGAHRSFDVFVRDYAISNLSWSEIITNYVVGYVESAMAEDFVNTRMECMINQL